MVCFKLQLHDAIYRLRFYSNSLIHILSLSNSHNNVASTPCIMCVQYRGGYLEYRGGVQYRGGIMINVGDILSTVGVFSTVGDIMSTMGVILRGAIMMHVGDIMNTVGGVQYRGVLK